MSEGTKMDLLQSFMSCMYPDIIRTDSIESMEHDCRFQAANIDEHGNEISQGELQITNDDLIYFKPSKFPTRWPLNFIRRYGCIDEGQKFVFEVGRKCSTGQAIFAFRIHLGRGNELVEKLNEKIDSKLSPTTGGHTKNQANNNHHRRTTTTQITTGTQASDESPAPRRKDVSTSTTTTTTTSGPSDQVATDPRPLSYVLIDFETTKALNESAQAHAANRLTR